MDHHSKTVLYAETVPMDPKVRAILRQCEADFMRDKGVMDWDNAMQSMPWHYSSYCVMQGLVLEARLIVNGLRDIRVMVVRNDVALWTWHKIGNKLIKENKFLDIVDS